MTCSEREKQMARYHWATLKQAGAELGGVSSAQVRRWIDDGDLPAFDTSKKNAKRRQFRIAREQLDAFKAKRTRNAA